MSAWLAPFLCLCLAVLTAGPAQAWEPQTARWTRITAETLPSHVVHYATLDPRAAAELLTRADAALLYDRADGTDLVPLGDIRMRSLHGLSREERFRITRLPSEQGGGYGLWDALHPHLGQPGRVDHPDAPVLKLLGLPTGGPGGQRAVTSPYDPLVVEFPGMLYAIRVVTLRIRDPLDPTRDTAAARVVTGTPISLDAILPGPRDAYRMILTFRAGTSSDEEPRIVFLPIDGQGVLEPDREGVIVRLSVAGSRLDPWSSQLDDVMQPIAVRLHLGDRDSLRAWLDALPPPDRSLFSEPGSPGDPLLIGPRPRRGPLGVGVQVRTGAEGRSTVLEPFDPAPRDSGVQPAFSGVDVEGWIGRAALGLSVSPEHLGGQLGFRAGSMRDTDATTVSVEVAVPLGVYAPTRDIGVAGVIRARRQTGTTLLRRTIEVGSDLRIGTHGFDYRALAGLRLYAGRGRVLTPTAFAAFRYGLPAQRGQAVFGVLVDGALNGNRFAPERSGGG